MKKAYLVLAIFALIVLSGFLVLEWGKYGFNKKSKIAEYCTSNIKSLPSDEGTLGRFITKTETINKNFVKLNEECLKFFEH